MKLFARRHQIITSSKLKQIKETITNAISISQEKLHLLFINSQKNNKRPKGMLFPKQKDPIKKNPSEKKPSSSDLEKDLKDGKNNTPTNNDINDPKKEKSLKDPSYQTTDEFVKEIMEFIKKNSQSSSNNNDPEQKKEINQKSKDMVIKILMTLLILFFVNAVFISKFLAERLSKKMDYRTFMDHLSKREIDWIEVVTQLVNDNIVKTVYVGIKSPIETKDQKSTTKRIYSNKTEMFFIEVFDVTSFLVNLENEMKQQRYTTDEYIQVKCRNGFNIEQELLKNLYNAGLVVLSAYIVYNIKNLKKLVDKIVPGNSGKQIKSFEVKKLQGGFKSVAGLENAKLEVHEFVDFLKNPFMYANIGAKMPKGALLTGPPGTGKTLLAKACAVESGVSFFAVSGSDFVEKYVGIGSTNVRRLFEEAKRKSPSVIFIDEIDAIGKKRNESAMFTNTERENTLNQLLVELDGFDSKTSVVVLAATNRPEILDSALVRPGRLDRHIALTLPDLEAREEIFELYLSKLTIKDGQIDFLKKRLASLSPQFSGADISNLCNEAAILAAREQVDQIELKHFEEATERIIGGLRRDNLVSKEERKLIATHESGHAVSSWFLKGADPLVKVTIVPRSKGALGYAQYLTRNDDIYTKSALIDRIIFILGGRVAEEIFFNKISTGAQDDLEKAFEIANMIVSKFGMTSEFGYMNLESSEERNNYSSQRENVKFSDATQAVIDSEIVRIIEYCHGQCTLLLNQKKGLVESLRNVLLEKESVTLVDLTSILGERPKIGSSELFTAMDNNV